MEWQPSMLEMMEEDSPGFRYLGISLRYHHQAHLPHSTKIVWTLSYPL